MSNSGYYKREFWVVNETRKAQYKYQFISLKSSETGKNIVVAIVFLAINWKGAS